MKKNIFLIALMVLPLAACLVLKILFTPEYEGVHISGAERIVPILVTEDIIYLLQVIHIHIADDRRTVSGRC